MKYMLEMKGIRKEFPGVVAVNNVDLEVSPGEVLALVGENGAGKSTLMKVLSGVNKPDQGSVIIDGQKVETFDPLTALEMGVGMIYQELSYIEPVSIAENIFVGRLPLKGKLKIVDFNKLKRDTAEILERVHVNRDPFTLVSNITIAERQLVEIARAISRNAKVIVFDEPTSALTDEESQNLLKLIRGLADEGRAIIYITHKMDEIFEIADSVLIMRDGARVIKANASEITKDQMIEYMVGRKLTNVYPMKHRALGDVVLEVNQLCGPGVHDVSFKTRRGEVVGIFGLMGCGRTAIMETIYGARPKHSGSVWLDGKELNLRSSADAVDEGLYYLPPERKTDGIIGNMTVKQNITISSLHQLTSGLLLKLDKEKKAAQEWIDKFTIRTPSLDKAIGDLSGGNQQKVLIARSLMTKPKVLIINEPTRGVDVGAKVEIYEILERMCEEGMSIIAICSEMPEILAISDRILCVHDGTITGEIGKKDFNQETLMRLAIGE